MNPKLKLTAYGVLLILCVWFGCGFYANYSAVTKAAAEPGANDPATTNAVTNTNINTAASGANTTPSQGGSPATPPNISSKRSAMIAYLAALVGAVIGLGVLIASDVTSFMGSQAVDFLFNDAGEGQRAPDYERAEAEWAKGKFLDAIQMMRDFLKSNPREMYAALRIAEIYEKDLRNYLAAALEYEEILKHRLPAERWGWAAIHLCNLYSKLTQSDKALALLRRIADEYPKTAAAKKARARLGLAEPEPEPGEAVATAQAEPELTGEQPAIIMEEHPPELEPRKESHPPPEATEPPEPPKPSLPPGFRPKK
jgi:TolA-binding protein